MIAEEKANLVANSLQKDGLEHVVAFDPITIAMIIGLLIELYKVISSCANDDPIQIASIARNPGFINKLKLNYYIRKHLLKTNLSQFLTNRLYKSILEVGQGVTPDDCKSA
jgi:hypothetical protein